MSLIILKLILSKLSFCRSMPAWLEKSPKSTSIPELSAYCFKMAKSNYHRICNIVRLRLQGYCFSLRIWFNPKLLTKVDRSIKLSPIGSSGSVFSLGDAVKISSDLEEAKQKQKDHGGWVDGMAEVCLIAVRYFAQKIDKNCH